MHEIETLAQFDEVVAAGHGLDHCVVQSLDLRAREDALARCTVDATLFMGCDVGAAEEDLRARGALLFPKIPDSPLNPYRASLYRAVNLYDTMPAGSYADSFDALAYAWTRAGGGMPSLQKTLVAALHDHAISDALEEYLDDLGQQQVVGVMGGHAVERGSSGYATTAALGMTLAQEGFLVASGGGPGAMEAANLGARLSPHGPEALGEALGMLASVPSFRPSIDDWVRVAFDVKARFAGGADTLGVPTWFYGHEPPNVFATRIAKYCSNAVREATLLELCRGGLIFLPGAAGTVQELFQAVTANYYATDPSTITPLVLVGIQQWGGVLPAWPLLRSLGTGRAMGDAIALVDTIEEAGAWLAAR
ncbi:LOG family protein [Tessaracoccus antarcticus]|uniref:Rossmann fold nucleotide-binding protein n=1 Tax=Tessaracoccus antarcticus TaxID=2479848 RepID=A0A3M0GMU5_9ACTN|nr:LOG family protein [Tessaracoccus antarcticus]RMB62519.1 Rossmann fold nucleotide-binding protein [Tessaracoccus antarcticus]